MFKRSLHTERCCPISCCLESNSHPFSCSYGEGKSELFIQEFCCLEADGGKTIQTAEVGNRDCLSIRKDNCSVPNKINSLGEDFVPEEGRLLRLVLGREEAYLYP